MSRGATRPGNATIEYAALPVTAYCIRCTGLAAANTLPVPAAASDWRTTNPWVATLLLMLRVLSWIAAAILLAAMTGLLKKSD